jgi:hypothetical protein
MKMRIILRNKDENVDEDANTNTNTPLDKKCHT